MKLFSTLLFTTLTFSSFAQLAKLTYTGEEQYRLKLDRGGPVIGTPFTKAIKSYSLTDLISDNSGGYLKFMTLKGASGSTKQGAYVHFMKLDQKLNIKSESDVHLLAEGSEHMQPVSSYESQGSLNLITAGPDKDMSNFSLTYWQFDLSNLTLLKKNINLVSLPFDKNKQYDFRSYKSKNGKGFVMTIMEEGGKKESPVMHFLSFNEDLSLAYKRSSVLPFVGNKGWIVETLVNNTGTVFCLLGHPDEKNEEITVNSLLVSSSDKNRMISLPYKDGALINCAIGLSSTGDVLLSGLMWPGKKEYTSGFVVEKLTGEGKLELLQEETFAPSLLDVLENSDKKGLKKEYYIRSVTERTNGVVDVVINYCLNEDVRYGVGSSSTFGGRTAISDAVIFSFDKGKLASTIPIKRNLENNTQRGDTSYGRSSSAFQRFLPRAIICT
jgi:hypothetical protein